MPDRVKKPNAVSIAGRMKKPNTVKKENTGKAWKKITDAHKK